MGDKNLIENQNIGFFSKIKKWFWSWFGGSKQKQNTDVKEIEFEQQKDAQNEEIYQEYKVSQDKLKYEFSTPTVSKQKIEKLRLDLDNGKAGIDELYGLSNEEIDELGKAYDDQINDTVSKLNEIEVSVNNYKRRLSKIQDQK